MSPGPLNPDRTSVLRRQAEERRLGGPDPALEVGETFRWRDGAFRLSERSLGLPAATGSTARSPETAVLAFYGAVARGDLQAATREYQAARDLDPTDEEARRVLGE